MLRHDLRIATRGPVDRSWTVATDPLGLLPQDLTGWTATAQARESYTSPTVLHAFTCSIVGGTVRIQATGAQTAAWQASWPSLVAVWDLVLTAPNGDQYPPLVGGAIVLDTYVTHP